MLGGGEGSEHGAVKVLGGVVKVDKDGEGVVEVAGEIVMEKGQDTVVVITILMF